MTDISLEEKASKLMELREKKDRIKSKLDDVSSQLKKIGYELMEIMESQDLKSFRHKKFGLITSAITIYGKIIDFGKAKAFFEAEGLDQELFKLKVESGRLNEFVRKWLDEKKTLPEGIGFSPKKYISVTRNPSK